MVKSDKKLKGQSSPGRGPCFSPEPRKTPTPGGPSLSSTAETRRERGGQVQTPGHRGARAQRSLVCKL